MIFSSLPLAEFCVEEGAAMLGDFLHVTTFSWLTVLSLWMCSNNALGEQPIPPIRTLNTNLHGVPLVVNLEK